MVHTLSSELSTSFSAFSCNNSDHEPSLQALLVASHLPGVGTSPGSWEAHPPPSKNPAQGTPPGEGRRGQALYQVWTEVATGHNLAEEPSGTHRSGRGVF